jgi:FHA domain-containing protein
MNSNNTHSLSQSDPFVRKVLDQQSRSKYGTTTFVKGQTDSHEVLLLIRGLIERIIVTPGLEYQLGRFDNPDAYQVDLSAYGAVKYGLSRLHASLFVRDNKLCIVDHGSTNGTYVGGERLPSNQATVLRKGSEILLGRLTIQIMFR